MKKLFYFMLALVFTTSYANAAIIDANLNQNSQQISKNEPISFKQHNLSANILLQLKFIPHTNKHVGVYWLPDYEEKLNSYIINDEDHGYDRHGECGNYKLTSIKPDTYKYDFTTKKNVNGKGLTCYTNIKCKSKFFYNSENCSGEYQLSGTACEGKYDSCVGKPCSSVGYYDDSQSGMQCSNQDYGGQSCYSCVDDPCYGLDDQDCSLGCSQYYSQCSSKCEICNDDNCDDVEDVSIPSNAHCSSKHSDCESKCAAWECDTGYNESGNSCNATHDHSYSCPSGFNSTNSWGTSAQTISKICSCGASSGTCYKEATTTICDKASCTAAGGLAEGLKICDSGGVGTNVTCCGQTYYKGCLADEKCTLQYNYPNGNSLTTSGYYFNKTCTTIDGKEKGDVTSCNYSSKVDGIQPPCKGYKYSNKSFADIKCSVANMGDDKCICGGVTFAKTCNEDCLLPYDYPNGNSLVNKGWYWNQTCSTGDGKEKGNITPCNYSSKVDGIQPPCKGFEYSNSSNAGTKCSVSNMGDDKCTCGGATFAKICTETCLLPYDYPNGNSLVNKGWYWNKTCITGDGKEKGDIKSCNYSSKVDGIQPPCKGFEYSNSSNAGTKCSYAVGGDICECGGAKFGTKCLSPCEKTNKTCPIGQTLVNTCEDINGIIWGDCQ